MALDIPSPVRYVRRRLEISRILPRIFDGWGWRSWPEKAVRGETAAVVPGLPDRVFKGPRIPRLGRIPSS